MHNRPICELNSDSTIEAYRMRAHAAAGPLTRQAAVTVLEFLRRVRNCPDDKAIQSGMFDRTLRSKLVKCHYLIVVYEANALCTCGAQLLSCRRRCAKRIGNRQFNG
jgi:hypothetical protein